LDPASACTSVLGEIADAGQGPFSHVAGGEGTCLAFPQGPKLHSHSRFLPGPVQAWSIATLLAFEEPRQYPRITG
jgi:hypothetical protein